MQHEGFDYAYDKRLYDRLREQHARPVREHFHAGLEYQDKLARFLENHDEPRAAATFDPRRSRGGRHRHVPLPGIAVLSPGPVRGTAEAHLTAPGARAAGTVRRWPSAVLRPAPVGARPRDGSRGDSGTCWNARPRGTATRPLDGFLAFAWHGGAAERLLVTVNYAANQGQCYVRLPFADLAGARFDSTI